MGAVRTVGCFLICRLLLRRLRFCFRVCGFDPVRNFCGWLLFSAPSLPRVVQRSSLGVVSFVWAPARVFEDALRRAGAWWPFDGAPAAAAEPADLRVCVPTLLWGSPFLHLGVLLDGRKLRCSTASGRAEMNLSEFWVQVSLIARARSASKEVGPRRRKWSVSKEMVLFEG